MTDASAFTDANETIVLSRREKAIAASLLAAARARPIAEADLAERFSVEKRNTVAALRGASSNVNRNRRRTMARALYGKSPLTLEEREEYAGRDVTGMSLEMREIASKHDHGRRYAIGGCMRHPAFTSTGCMTAVQKSSGKVHLRGVNRCGSVWTCAECAQIIEAHRGEEVRQLIEVARDRGYVIYMVTYTFRHLISDTCKESMDGLADAVRKARQRRKYRAAQSMLGFVGLVRSTEVTHGSNGWHTHVHELWVCDPDGDDACGDFFNASTIKAAVFPEWRKAVVSVFGEDRAPSYKHGLDVKEVWSATDYIAKFPDEAQAREESGKSRWGADAELTKTTRKKGKASSTIWELMDRIYQLRLAGQDEMALVLERDLVDYARGTYRKRRMYWTPTRGEKLGLRDRFGLQPEQEDEDIVSDAGDHIDPDDESEVDIDINSLPLIAKLHGLTSSGYLERFQDLVDDGVVLVDVMRDDGWVLDRIEPRFDGVPRYYAHAGNLKGSIGGA